MKKSWAFVIAFALLFAFMSQGLAKHADELTKIRFEIVDEQRSAGQPFQVNVVAYDARDMYGVQFILHYDPEQLSLEEESGITVDDQFSPYGASHDGESGTVALPLIYNGQPYEYADRLLLATFTFKPLHSGETSLSLSDVIAVNRSLFEVQDRADDHISIVIEETERKPVVIQLVSADGYDLDFQQIEGLKVELSDGQAGYLAAQSDDAGVVRFEHVPAGLWNVTLSDHLGIVQTQKVMLFQSEHDSPAESIELPIAQLQSDERIQQPFSLIDVYAFVKRMHLHRWDLNFDGVTDELDAAEVLERVQPAVVLTERF